MKSPSPDVLAKWDDYNPVGGRPEFEGYKLRSHVRHSVSHKAVLITLTATKDNDTWHQAKDELPFSACFDEAACHAKIAQMETALADTIRDHNAATNTAIPERVEA